MDSVLMKRLLGALVLIALAVIFIPMLFPGSKPGTGAQTVGVDIPPQPSAGMQTRTLDVGPNSASAGPDTRAAVADADHVATVVTGTSASASSATILPPGPVVSAPASAAAASAPMPAPALQVAQSLPAATSARPAAGAAPTPQHTANAAPLPGGPGAAAGTIYTVNLGIYADRTSAKRLVANAKQHGFTALASPETYQGKPVLRVQAGPYPDRAAAEAARLKLKAFEPGVQMSVQAATLDQKGDVAAAALPAAQPGAFAVQLGAYGDEATANKLRDRLRAGGFDGYVDSVQTAKGTLWRVRAGPYASRTEALATRGKIATSLAVTGDVVTQR